MKFNVFNLLLVVLTVSTLSCGDEAPINTVDNATLIQNYITDNNLDAIEVDDTGLFYIVEKEGNGEFPTINDFVTVHYHGTFLDGEVFDSSVDRGAPSSFALSRVIAGWQLGIPKFSKGGKGTLIIPSNLAYGPSGTNGIPGFSVLLFEVELIEF